MPKILVVNNDFDFMTLLQTWLERKHYEVEYTGAVEEVPQIVRKFNPDLVILDIMQSGIVEKLKTDRETHDVRVLLMTGYTLPNKLPPQVKVDDVIVKVDDVIEKPFNLRLLEKKIETLIRA